MAGKSSKINRKKELLTEKRISGEEVDSGFTLGENFVEEPTGSATMVNLDGRNDLGHHT